VPRSRLILNNRPFLEPEFRSRFLARLTRHRIDPARVDLIYTEPQPNTWASYGRVDIALDPFPHNAGTTTIEALWQGVPVVSLAARPTVGRFGASILHAVGLDAWVADDIHGYVAHAVAAAADLDTLAALRTGLRQRVAASPLCDAPGLARQIEAAYRMLWDEWRTRDEAALRRLYAEGDLPAAAALAQHFLQEHATSAVANHVLGLLAYREGRLGDADAHLQAAVARDPGTAELHANHAAILRKLGRLAEAETAARAALQLDPGCVGAHNNLGNLLRDAGRFDESAVCFRAAISLAPGFADAWVNLAWVLALAGHAQQAEEASRQAIACEPKNADAHNNLGLALMRQGRLVEAEAALRDALALRPDFALPHSNILFCLNYRPDASAEEIFAEYRRWDHVHARPLLTAQPNFDLDRSPDRRLRIGYVSPDFRQHAVALFAEPLLAAHDRSVVEVHCYGEVPAPDAVTQRLRELADHWHSTVGLSDAELAEQIRRDRIDVLVDLAGHTAGNRLLAFARRPAPIQVEWLLGHGYSSGLSAMDAFLADAALAPPGAERLFSERLVRLSRIPLAYAPPDEMPDVAPLPASANGHITFGYFGRTVRLNDNVLAIWTRILHAVPGSRLMLNSAPFGEPAGRRQMFARFAALGIQPERLDLVHTSPQPHTWAAYGQIDIALDPFPHNAGTTTIEALWQGVPVLSLAGRPTVGRFGASILHAVGLDDWITGDVEGYVQRAVTAAADIAPLTRLRAGLRARFAASPLCDAAGLAREFEAAYRTLWRQWSGDGTHLRRLHAAGEDRAEAALRQALALDPLDASAHFTLGALLGKSARPVEAEAHHRAALAGAGDRHRVLSNLSIVLQMQGRHAEAAQCCRDALAARPDYAVAHSNLLSSLDHRVDLSAEAIFAEYRNWDRQHAASLPTPEVRPVVHWSAERRLRVGYVSADFCQHAAASFAEPLLAAHDRQRIELFCYAAVARPDAVTERFRTIAEHWRDIVALDDAAAAELIRRDAIDVLVDLTGHTAGSRLLIFARRPAPVQVEYLLGHGYTSGLTAMDAFLADAALAPPAAEALFSERLVRLPRIPLAYAPPRGMPEVTPLPATGQGFITFGYFGRCERLTDAVIGAWSRILRELPCARLVMNSAPFREAAFRDLTASRFVVHGVERDRLALIATRPQSATWAAYGGIDIALDPFPHNAGTTTIEALWQGVPVVSLAGRPSVGRFGAMILHAVAMDDWVAADVDAYVARALAASTDLERLARLRASLRQRVAGSPLCDTAGLARHVEDAFRALCKAC
jgi:predicted O-linked N-acetylglucosamine transferase (SPINDLY family)